MANEQLRKKIKKSRIFHYEIAGALGITESAFSKLLRAEMEEQQKVKIVSAINKLTEKEI